MTLDLAYVIVSALLLAFVGFIWSSERGWNIIIKIIFVGAAFAGAVMVARMLSL